MGTKKNNITFPNDIIYWEGPGWYYYMGGWKYSLNQGDNKESEIAKSFSSYEEAERIFCKVIDVKRR